MRSSDWAAMHTIAKDGNCIPCLVEMAAGSITISPFLNAYPGTTNCSVPGRIKDAVLFSYICISACTSNTNLGTGLRLWCNHKVPALFNDQAQLYSFVSS